MLEIELPDDGNSPDFTQVEADSAITTLNEDDVAAHLRDYIQANGGQLRKHELRRKDFRLYWRVTVGSEGGEETLVFRVDWLERGQA